MVVFIIHVAMHHKMRLIITMRVDIDGSMLAVGHMGEDGAAEGVDFFLFWYGLIPFRVRDRVRVGGKSKDEVSRAEWKGKLRKRGVVKREKPSCPLAFFPFIPYSPSGVNSEWNSSWAGGSLDVS